MKKWFAWVASSIVIGLVVAARPSPAHVHPAGLDHRGVQRQHRPRPHQQDERLDHHRVTRRHAGVVRAGGRTAPVLRPLLLLLRRPRRVRQLVAPASGYGLVQLLAVHAARVLQLLHLHEGPAVRGHQRFGQNPGRPGQRSQPAAENDITPTRPTGGWATSSGPRTRPTPRWPACYQIRRPRNHTDGAVNEDGQWFTPSAGLSYWFSTWNGIDADLSYTRGLYEGDNESNFDNYDGRPRFNHRISRVRPAFTASTTRSTASGTTPATPPHRGGSAAGLLGLRPVGRRLPRVRPDPEGLARRRLLLPAGQKRQRPERPVHLQSDINKLWDFQRWSMQLRTASGIDSQDFTGDQQGFERYAQAE